MNKKILKIVGIIITVLSYPFGANTAHFIIYPMINKTSLSFEEYSALEATYIIWIAIIGLMMVLLSNQKETKE